MSSSLVQAVQHFTLARLIADPSLCRNALNDTGATPSEVFVLIAALEARIPQTLLDHVATNDISVLQPRLVADLHNRGVDRARADWAVDQWAHVVLGSTLGGATVAGGLRPATTGSGQPAPGPQLSPGPGPGPGLSPGDGPVVGTPPRFGLGTPPWPGPGAQAPTQFAPPSGLPQTTPAVRSMTRRRWTAVAAAAVVVVAIVVSVLLLNGSGTQGGSASLSGSGTQSKSADTAKSEGFGANTSKSSAVPSTTVASAGPTGSTEPTPKTDAGAQVALAAALPKNAANCAPMSDTNAARTGWASAEYLCDGGTGLSQLLAAKVDSIASRDQYIREYVKTELAVNGSCPGTVPTKTNWSISGVVTGILYCGLTNDGVHVRYVWTNTALGIVYVVEGVTADAAAVNTFWMGLRYP